MQREPITRETVKLTPWDKVSLTRPWIVPLWLSTGEIVALNLRETDLCEGDKRLVMKGQGIDPVKWPWRVGKTLGTEAVSRKED